MVALARRSQAAEGNAVAIAEMLTLEMVEFLAPTHERASCSDESSNGNEYANEFGVPRCTRCALRSLVNNGGSDPYGKKAAIRIDVQVLYGGDERRYPESRVK